MPADFLNAEQRASYGQFSGEPNDVQLARFFLLDEADMEFINNRRGRTNRFAVALMIGCVRFLGTWPHDLSSIPANAQWFVGHCCKVSDEAAFCLIQRPYISKTLLTRRISPRGSP
ncbi:hypothetical protein CJU68_25460 [Escherichia coli]|nr:hypothetical protein CJU68_25460 [Escherichia coli]